MVLILDFTVLSLAPLEGPPQKTEQAEIDKEIAAQ